MHVAFFDSVFGQCCCAGTQEVQAAVGQQKEQSQPLAIHHDRAVLHALQLCGGDFLGSVDLTAPIGPREGCLSRLECRALLRAAIEQEESPLRQMLYFVVAVVHVQ